MASCPECNGKGTITLLYSRNPCRACGGSGRAAVPEPNPEKTDAPVVPTAYTTYSTGATTSTDSLTITGGVGGGGGGGITIVTGSSPEGSSGAIGFVMGTNVSAAPPLTEWVAERLNGLADGVGPEWQVGPTIPAIAPLSMHILADMVMLLEQEGEEPEAFVCSCRDFADVLKFGDAPMLKWEERNAVYFGTPILRSRDVPVGHVVLVSKTRKAVLCDVCR